METKENKEESKSKKPNLFFILFVIIVILLIIIVFLIQHIISLNNKLSEKLANRTIIQKEPYRDWYKEECKCVEWKGEKTCLEGLKLNSSLGSLCYNQDGKTSSPASIACSKYECDECFVSIKKKA